MISTYFLIVFPIRKWVEIILVDLYHFPKWERQEQQFLKPKKRQDYFTGKLIDAQQNWLYQN